MKIAIIGSRTFDNYDLLFQEVYSIIAQLDNVELHNVTIVSGGAKGADSLGAKFAKENELELVIYEANWKDLSHPDARIKTNGYGEYDANAGHRRNTLIINDADIVIAFHNDSPGTKNSLGKARKAGKKIYEFKF